MAENVYKTIKKTIRKYQLDEEGNRIKNEKGKCVYTKEEVEFIIDTNWTPSNKNEVCIEYIENYVDKHNEGKWFYEVLTQKDSSGKPIPTERICAKFIDKFFPEIKGKKVKSKRSQLLDKYSKFAN